MAEVVVLPVATSVVSIRGSTMSAPLLREANSEGVRPQEATMTSSLSRVSTDVSDAGAEKVLMSAPLVSSGSPANSTYKFEATFSEALPLSEPELSEAIAAINVPLEEDAKMRSRVRFWTAMVYRLAGGAFALSWTIVFLMTIRGLDSQPAGVVLLSFWSLGVVAWFLIVVSAWCGMSRAQLKGKLRVAIADVNKRFAPNGLKFSVELHQDFSMKSSSFKGILILEDTRCAEMVV